jgi:hypothetical protein
MLPHNSRGEGAGHTAPGPPAPGRCGMTSELAVWLGIWGDGIGGMLAVEFCSLLGSMCGPGRMTLDKTSLL